jgi:photosystem II stability/assembly factor-like uncharacterized protein
MKLKILSFLVLFGMIAALFWQPGSSASDPAAQIANPGSAPQPAYASASWVYTGGPLGGLGYDVRMDPRNSSVMYVTDSWAGAFKSINGGMSWFPINTNLPPDKGPSADGISVFSLTIDPNNPDRIWAGGQSNNGVYRSDDGGESWQTLTDGVLESFLSVRGFTVEPGNSDVVYFAAEVSSSEWNGSPLPGTGLDMTKGVVYKSTNAGVSWTRLWFGDNLARYIWIHPQDHNLLYVSTGIFDREAANSDQTIPDPGGVGILKSMDGGDTWDVLDDSNGFDPDELSIGSLFMHPLDPLILVAGSGNDAYSALMDRPLGGVYISRDGGDTWSEAVEGHNFSAVEICTSDPNVWYAGAKSGVFRSLDNGLTWQQLAGANWGPPDVVAGFPIDLQCDPQDPLRLFANNYGGGNFLSTDGGETWSVASQGYTGALMRQIDVHPSAPTQVYASGRSGFFRTGTGGSSWEGLGYGPARLPEGTALAVDPSDWTHLLAASDEYAPQILLSWDGGRSWESIPPPFALAEDEAFLDFYFLPSPTGRVLASSGPSECMISSSDCDVLTGHGLIVSDDGGETWQPTNLVNGNVVSVAWGGEGEDLTAYAVVWGQGLFRSNDLGLTWTMINANPYPQGVTPSLTVFLKVVAINPFNLQYLYAGYNYGGIAISEDGGMTWLSAVAGLPAEAQIMDIVLDPERPGVVYAGAYESGIYYSTNGGETWMSLNSGLLTRAVHDLSLTENGSVLYMASEGAGVFRLGEITYQLYLPLITRR